MPATIDPFYAIGINLLARALEATGRDVLHLEFGQPAGGAPKAAIAAAHEALDGADLGYWESPALRSKLAALYRTRYGLDIAPERFVITCGASPALVLALAARFEAGDTIVTARPGYVAYRNTLKGLHLTPVEIACGPDSRYQLAAAHIEALDPAPAGAIIASPANPTGTIIPPTELAAIAEICRAQNISLISDEIYHGLSYVAPAQSVLSFDPDAFVVGSFSKYFGMHAWRLGWLVAPPSHIDRARALIGNLFLTAPALSQQAALAALDATEELEARVEIYRGNRDVLLAALPQLGLTRIAPPDGAFYIYADVGHLTDDSLAFCRRMLTEIGVAAAPGIDFDPDHGRRHIRLSFAVSRADMAEAIARLIPWFGRQG